VYSSRTGGLVCVFISYRWFSVCLFHTGGLVCVYLVQVV